MEDVSDNSKKIKSKEERLKRATIYSLIGVLILGAAGAVICYNANNKPKDFKGNEQNQRNGNEINQQELIISGQKQQTTIKTPKDQFFVHYIVENSNIKLAKVKNGEATFEIVSIPDTSYLGFGLNPDYVIGQNSETLCLAESSETRILAYKIDLKTKTMKKVLNIPYSKSLNGAAVIVLGQECESALYYFKKLGQKKLYGSTRFSQAEIKSLDGDKIEMFELDEEVFKMYPRSNGRIFELTKSNDLKYSMNEILKNDNFKRENVFDVEAGKLRESSIQFSDDSNTILYMTKQNEVFVCDVKTKSITEICKIKGTAKLSPDGSKVAVMTEFVLNRTIVKIFDIKTLEVIKTVSIYSYHTIKCWANDGNALFFLEKHILKKLLLSEESPKIVKSIDGEELTINEYRVYKEY